MVKSFSFILSHRVCCCGSCVVSFCSQWREQTFRDGSSVCHRNPSGSLLGCLLLSVAYRKHEYDSYEYHTLYLWHLYSCGGLAFCYSQPLCGCSWSLTSARWAPAHSIVSSPGPLPWGDGPAYCRSWPRAVVLKQCWLSVFRFSSGAQPLVSNLLVVRQGI